MLSQEFELLNVVKVWDTLLSDTNRWNFIFYLCISLVQMKRDIILKSDFSEIMEALQRNNVHDENNDQSKFIDLVISQAKKICLAHTRTYDYFIEKTLN